MKRLTDFLDIDLNTFNISKEELKQEHLETYKIFKETMLELNPDYDEGTIKSAFKSKFNYNDIDI